MARIQSWTLDKAVLNSRLKLHSLAALDKIKEVDAQNRQYFAYRTGNLINATKINENLNMMIDVNQAAYAGSDNVHRLQDPMFNKANKNHIADTARRNVADMLPEKTGNLKHNAFKYTIQDDKYDVFIDYSIAPYAQYPNVKKIIDANWPMIKKRYQMIVKQLLSTSRGMYNNQGVKKIQGAGWRGEEYEWTWTKRWYDESTQSYKTGAWQIVKLHR